MHGRQVVAFGNMAEVALHQARELDEPIRSAELSVPAAKVAPAVGWSATPTMARARS
ncbi:MAG TPA: hypothetical protein VME20_07425 [Acidimicrobiales bacterium]|nr:hypothetical protein [Acidimicrobiales bacterium]